MTRRLRLAEAARSLRPYQQGELDSLCGLYTVINAVRVAVWPRRISTSLSQQLFAVGLRALSRARKLMRGLTIGIDEPTLSMVCEAVIGEASHLLGTKLMTVRPVSGAGWNTARAIRFLRSQVRAGFPVIVGFEGRLDHWTLVTSHSATRLIFHDSSGLHWVAMSAVCLVDDGTNKPHPITTGGLVALISVPPTSLAGAVSARRRRIPAPRRGGIAP